MGCPRSAALDLYWSGAASSSGCPDSASTCSLPTRWSSAGLEGVKKRIKQLLRRPFPRHSISKYVKRMEGWLDRTERRWFYLRCRRPQLQWCLDRTQQSQNDMAANTEDSWPHWNISEWAQFWFRDTDHQQLQHGCRISLSSGVEQQNSGHGSTETHQYRRADLLYDTKLQATV